MKRLKLFFACLLMAVLSIGQVWADDVTDELTASDLAATSTTYVDFSSVSKTSDAVYAGNSAKSSAGGIQLRSKNSNSGIVSTTSGGVVKSVTITVASGSNTIDVYGSNTAYTGAGDLYDDNKQGTKVGSLTATGTITFTDEYAYVGIRSNNGAIYLTSVDITWTSAAPPTYTIAAESNNTTYGTVSLSGSVITGSPKSGCRYASPAYTVLSGDAEVAQNGNAFTVTPSSDCTVQINFEAIPQYKVTWNVSGDETLKTDVYEGEKPVFPATPAACDATSTTFIGWATAPWTGKSADLSEKTVYTSASAMPDVTGAVTYYAVFAKVAGESGWIETAIADLGASDIFVIVGDNGSTYAMVNNNGTSSAPGASAVTIADSKISGAVADNIKWNISGNATDGYTFYPNGDSEKWLYCTNANNGVRVGTNENKTFTIVDGYLKHSGTSRYVGIYNNQDWRCYTATSTNIDDQTFKFYKYTAGTALDYMTTCCTKYDISIADGITNGSISADLAKACEGTTVTITFSPAGGYHLESWSLNGTAQDVNDNTFTMLGEAVTVSATFAHDDCANLAAPTLDAITKTYNSATIAWNEVADAEEYAVSVVNHATSESVFAGNVDALSKALENLEPETQYDYSIMAVGDGTVKCADGNGVLEGDFTTEALPTAHLTLIDPNGTHASSGDYTILTPFNLPSTAAYCAKTFMGWDADENCATAPTYTKGQSFTFENTTSVTLYAVYADVTGGSTSTTDIKCTVSTTTNMTGGNDADLLVDETDAADAGWIVTGYKGGGSNYPGLNKDGTIRLYYNAGGNSYIDVTAPSAITSIEVTCKAGNDNFIVKVGDATIALDEDVYPINATSFRIINGYTESNQVHIQNIAVNFVTPGTPSNYSTTCAAAPEVIVDPEEVNVSAAAVAAGVIEAAYDNVDEENLSVALFNDQACTEAFDGGWLTASINGDNNIAYAITEYTSYANDRKAYIQLTAPASSTGVAAAVVVIPVTQAKKAAVFASLEELVAADVNANTNVTVTLTDVTIKSIYYYPNTPSEDNRKGLVFDIQKEGQDIKIYYNAKVPTEWVAGGKVSGTLTDCPWKIYSGAWQLAPAGEWAWNNLTYTAPAAIESLEIRGNATKKTYIDGQAFDHAGLTAWAIYSDTHEEEVTALATWTYDPAKLSESDTEVTVTATYAEKSDDETVTGLTVNPIPNKTIAQFIADEGGRCYLEGIVSGNINTTYGNFDLQDETGTIYVYGSDVFEDHGVAIGDKVKVIAEEYLLYKKAGNPDKDEALNVVFVSKVSAATIDIDDIDMTEGEELLLSDIVATITPDAAQSAEIAYAVSDGDAVVIEEGKIKAVAEGEATITASIAAGTGYLAGSTTFTVSVAAAPTPVPENTDIITAAKIGVEGNSYVAWTGKTGFGTSSVYAGNTTNGTGTNAGALQLRYNATDASKRGGIVLTSSNGLVLKGLSVTAKSGSGTLNVYAKSTAYSGYADVLDDATCGTLIGTVSGTGDLQLEDGISYDDNYQYIGMRSASGTLYLSDITITWGEPVTPPTPVYETVRENLVADHYYTLCFNKTMTAVQGATFWSLASKDAEKVYLVEEQAPYAAGKPYIIYAEAAGDLTAVLEGAATDEAGSNGVLYGTFAEMTQAALSDKAIDLSSDIYLLSGNKLWNVTGTGASGNWLAAGRAYIALDNLAGGVPQPAPGRRVRAIPMGQNTVTGIDELNASETPVKMIIDGQLYILRGEKMYNANGQIVK